MKTTRARDVRHERVFDLDMSTEMVPARPTAVRQAAVPRPSGAFLRGLRDVA
jgi:hypothetical protein